MLIWDRWIIDKEEILISFNILEKNIVAFVPVYQENKQEIMQVLSSFQNLRPTLPIHVVIIVDGVGSSVKYLEELLNIPQNAVYFQEKSFNYINGKLVHFNFTLLIKQQHAGKRDSIGLFLDLLTDNIENDLNQLKQKYPNESNIENILKKHELSIFMVDCDTHFEKDAIDYLYQTLWHLSWDVYCATPFPKPRIVKGNQLLQYGYQMQNQVANYFYSYAMNGSCASSEQLLGLQACGMFKAFFVANKKLIALYRKKPENFIEAITFDMNEDTYLTSLLKDKNPKCIYVPEAKVSTVPPNAVSGFLVQRKRWLNGNSLQHEKIIKNEQKNISILSVIFNKLFYIFKKMLGFSPASYFYLLLSVICIILNTEESITIEIKNYLFCLCLFSITLTSLLFRANRFPLLYNVLGHLIVLFNLLVYAGIIFLAFKTFFGFLSLHVALAVMAMGIGPFATLCIIGIRKKLNFAFFYGLLGKYLLIDTLSFFILPIYACANFDDISWGTREAGKQNKQYDAHIIKEGAQIKNKRLSFFLLENMMFSLLLSFLPIAFILGLVIIRQILYQLAFILAPWAEEKTEQQPLYSRSV